MNAFKNNPSSETIQGAFRQAEQLENAGNFAQALSIYQQIAKAKPRWPFAYFGIGSAYAGMGRFEDARRNLRKAIGLKDDHSAFHAKISEVYNRLDDQEHALAAADRAIELEPTNPHYLANKAMILRFNSDTRSAHELLEKAVCNGERDDQLVRVYASLCGSLSKPQVGIEALEPLTRTVNPDPMVTATHFFTLTKLYDQAAHYDQAFEAARRGSALRGDVYEPGAREEQLAQRLDAWSGDRMGSLARSRVVSDKPVFIVGMPRSGTTLIEQIIAAHRDAYGAGELINIFSCVEEMGLGGGADTELKGVVESLKAATLDRVARRILRNMEKQVPKGSKPIRITDKLPLNFQHLGLIEQLFPNARVIHCMRHPLDVFVSCYLLDFGGVNAHAYTYDPDHFAHFYSLYLKYMEHWRSVCSIPILDVSYEETVADQRATTERILSFLDLEWDDSCLRFFEAKRSVNTASTEQVRRAMYSSSVGRWKHYEGQLGKVMDALRGYGVAF